MHKNLQTQKFKTYKNDVSNIRSVEQTFINWRILKNAKITGCAKFLQVYYEFTLLKIMLHF